MSTDSIPKTMKAIKLEEPKKAICKDDAPVPQMRDDYILVKVRAVALNPTDWKHIDYIAKNKVTIGCDYAGDVVEVGPKVTKGWKVGDRVCGLAFGGNDDRLEDGSFGEYLIAKGDVQMRIPDEMDYTDASTFGVGVITIGQGLYDTFGLPLPGDKSKAGTPILVYGGSSNTGVAAIQWLALSDFDIHVTCSPHNFDFVKSLGAKHVYDYKSPTCGADIRKATNDELYYAYDTISEGDSPKICFEALSSHAQPSGAKPQYCSILPVQEFPRDDVDTHFTLGYTAVGEPFHKMGKDWPAQPEHFENCKKTTSVGEKLMAEGKIKPHRTDVRKGGVEKILEGLEDYRQGKVSAKKIVYSIA